MEDVILLDTCILFNFLADREKALETERLLGEGKGAVCSITVYELFRGVESEEHLKQRAILLSFLHVIDLTSPIARTAGRIWTKLQKNGLLIANEDILTGAAAVYYGIPLFTENKKHFEHIDGLRLYTYGPDS